jgi:NAD(P) transhydrogenase subunit alpha
MYAKNVATFLQHVVRDGALPVDLADEITAATCVTHAGAVRLGAKS